VTAEASSQQWVERPLWAVARPGTEVGRPDLPLLSVFLDRGVIPYGEGGGQVHKPSATLDAYQVVHPGDLVLNNQQAWRGSVGVSRHTGIVSPAYVIRRLGADFDAEWANYLFRSPVTVAEFNRASRGVGSIQRQLHLPSLRRIRVRFPSLADQRLAVRYLHHQEVALAQAAAAKQRLIAALDEAAAAMRWESLTGGEYSERIRPRVEWMGPVPKSWRTLRIKNLIREVDQRTRSGTEPLLSLRLREGLVPSAEHSKRPLPSPTQLQNYKLVEAGQLVMNRMRASIGVFGIAGSAGLVSPDYATFEPHQHADVHLPYLLLLLKSPQMGAVLRAHSRGMGTGSSGFLRLYTDRFGAVHIALPDSRAEQERRANEALERTSHLTAAVNAAQHELRLLSEYRVRLVNDVITGQRDVRDQASELPDIDAHEVDAVMAQTAETDEEEVADVDGD
jgi:type I restriction enzyme S subunit